jgi:hypothetical protein
MKYDFHPEAEEELYEAAAYYEAGLSGLGHDFDDEVNRVINHLSSASCAPTATNRIAHPPSWFISELTLLLTAALLLSQRSSAIPAHLSTMTRSTSLLDRKFP